MSVELSEREEPDWCSRIIPNAVTFARQWLAADYDASVGPEWRNLARAVMRMHRELEELRPESRGRGDTEGDAESEPIDVCDLIARAIDANPGAPFDAIMAGLRRQFPDLFAAEPNKPCH